MTHLQDPTNAADKTAVVKSNFEKLDTNLLKGTSALDFGSISAAASADLTISVTGAAVGDGVVLSLPAAPTAGIVFMAFVSATDTVTVRAMNITGSPVDPASATYQVQVVKY